MGKKVVTTPMFRWKVSKVVKYIQTEFGNKAMLEFVSRLDAHVQMASEHPTTGIALKNNIVVRYFIVKPHNKLYYKIYPSRITLLDLFDMRQHSSKNPFQ